MIPNLLAIRTATLFMYKCLWYRLTHSLPFLSGMERETFIADCAHSLVNVVGATVDVHGDPHILENLKDKPWIIMSNHRSHFDIPLVLYALGPTMRMVAKQELLKTPFFGPTIHRLDMVTLDRHNKKHSWQQLEEKAMHILPHAPLWLAPEGTRSKNKKLGHFKRGGFLLAQKHGARILPIAINGSETIFPAGSVRIQHGQHVDIHILPHIDSQDYSGEHAIEHMSQDLKHALENALN